MPKAKPGRIKVDCGDRLLDYETEQKANMEVYKHTGICIHPLKDLRYGDKGCEMLCVCCGSKLGEIALPSPISPHREIMLREMFSEVARMFGLEIVDVITEKCVSEWKKTSLTLSWSSGGNLTIRRDSAAYIFYKVCVREEIYLRPSEVARFFDTTLAKMLLAEDIYCMESGSEKIFVPISKQFEPISKWMFLSWAEKNFVCSLIEHFEKELFGKSAENIMMIALCLSKKLFPASRVDVERAEHLLDVKSLKENSAQLLHYQKLFKKELCSLLGEDCNT